MSHGPRPMAHWRICHGLFTREAAAGWDLPICTYVAFMFHLCSISERNACLLHFAIICILHFCCTLKFVIKETKLIKETPTGRVRCNLRAHRACKNEVYVPTRRLRMRLNEAYVPTGRVRCNLRAHRACKMQLTPTGRVRYNLRPQGV